MVLETEKTEPLVSIIIPVYNGSNYMCEAIDSALNQTYKNIEVIVVNDGSNDDGETHRIALSYGSKIRYIHKENGGVSSALNEGIRQMRGEYFSWLSHDDVYGPDKIAHQVPFANNKTVVMCGRYLIDCESQLLGDVRERFRFKDIEKLDHQEALIALLSQGCFNGCTLLIPREAFGNNCRFDEGLRYCQDLLMWLKIFIKGYGLNYIPDKDVYSRVHDAQLTNTGRDLFHSDCKKLSDAVSDDLCRISSCQYNILYEFAKYNAVYYNPSVVKKCIKLGNINNLFKKRDIFKLHITLLYGRVRPVIRWIYYAIFKNIKTN